MTKKYIIIVRECGYGYVIVEATSRKQALDKAFQKAIDDYSFVPNEDSYKYEPGLIWERPDGDLDIIS